MSGALDPARTYLLEVASDVIRDGLGLELVVIEDGSRRCLVEVFRSDADNTVSVFIEPPGVPLRVLEAVIAEARAMLNCFEDGAALDAAKGPDLAALLGRG